MPFLAHESTIARMERTIKRLILTLVFITVLWFSTIGVFVWYLYQYDFESYTYQQDGEGLNISGDRNGVDFNVAESDSSPQD